VVRLQTGAESADAEAQYELAVLCQLGLGMPNGPERAVDCYRKAAEQGWPEAQLKLGLCYAEGAGVLAGPSAAIEGYSKAAGSYLGLGQRDGALTCYDRMRELDPGHPLTIRLFGQLHGEAEQRAGPSASAEKP
jgi:TPR repeat protein